MSFLFYFSLSLYITGILNCIFLTNRNLLSFLIAAEFMFLGIDILYIGTSLLLDDRSGLIYALLTLMLAVGESAIGLGLCVLSLKLDNSIKFVKFSNLKY